MNASRALPRPRQAGLDRDMELGRGPTLLHFIDVDGRAAGELIFARPAHLHDAGQHGVGRLERGHAHADRAKPPDLMLRRNGALLPGVGRADPTVVDQGEPLALRILEFEGRSTVPRGDRLLHYAMFAQSCAPPFQARFAIDPERGADDGMRPAAFARHGPVEEGKIGTRRRLPIGIEEVIGADIVLIDRLLHEPHAEHARVEGVVRRRVGRDRREVMNPFELHGSPSARNDIVGSPRPSFKTAS